MNIFKRRIFFYTLTLVFFIVSPLLLGYAMGYTFNFGKGIVEQTGGIFLKSRTPLLSLFVDENFIQQTSYWSGSALLTNLTSGAHLLRLEKAGYSPWSKTITVQPSLVTDLRNVLLAPDPVPLLTTSPKESALLIRNEKAGALSLPRPREKLEGAAPQVSAPESIYQLDNKRNLVGAKGTTTGIVAANVHSFATLDSGVYFIDQSGFLARFDLSSFRIETIGRPGFYLDRTLAEFVQAPGGQIIIRDSAGGIYIADSMTNVQGIPGNVKSLALDENGEKLLLVKSDAVELYWMSDNVYEPFQKKGTQEVIIPPGRQVMEAMWFLGDYAHVATRFDDTIVLTEIDGRGGRNSVELFKRYADKLFTLPDYPRTVFLRIGKTYFKIEL